MFLHFGVNTFTDREWGDGTEDPAVFNPSRLDARQWVSVAKECGFGYVILTAKHHDGFCLWPSEHTEHSVKNSPWRGGDGDVMREFVDACAEFDVKGAFYLSPWDRHEPSYGDSPRYNEYFRAQLRELLTNYGDIAEAWFDGACAEGPNGKRQEYDWASYYALIREIQPDALIAICGPDVRWVGNEDGYARETEWSVQAAHPVHQPGATGDVWYPAECDVSIRPGWFWHAAEDDKVKTLDHLMDIYHKSVGRNSVLLMNVPPNTDGLLADPDVARLREFRAEIDRRFGDDLVGGGDSPGPLTDGLSHTFWSPPDDALPASVRLDLPSTREIAACVLKEHIAEGQRVERYTLSGRVAGEWITLGEGTTIGHKKIDRVEPVAIDAVELCIEASRGTPMIRALSLHADVE
ncbi:MAG: alpha-L-fucosidase [Candidatus Poribacteria bacterium]